MPVSKMKQKLKTHARTHKKCKKSCDIDPRGYFVFETSGITAAAVSNGRPEPFVDNIWFSSRSL